MVVPRPRQVGDILNDLYETTKTMTVEQAKVCFRNAKAQQSALNDVTFEQFSLFWLQSVARDRERNQPPTGTAAELWNAVCAWNPDPLGSPPDGDPAVNTLLSLLHLEHFERVLLGKFEGKYMCALEPTICLESDEDAYDPVIPAHQHLHQGVSVYNAIRAILYADGYPSQASTPSSSDPTQTATAASGPKLATEDKILRRFMPLGVEYFEDHGSQIVHVPKTVRLNDARAYGVLPGNVNRTTIAPLAHCKRTKVGKGKFASHFGEDFNFELGTMGKHIRDVQSPRGPDLVHIADWWWDPKVKEEVCFSPAGVPTIRYNGETRRYDGPNTGPPSAVGNIFGTLPPPAQPPPSRDFAIRPGPSGSGSSQGHGPDQGRAQGHPLRQTTTVGPT